MNFKCWFGFHDLKKYGGPHNVGDGKFMQRYICFKCKTIKKITK